MLKTGEAREILGVSRDANKNEIERKYSILLKKHRINVSEGTVSPEVQREFEEVTKAYNFLMGYDEPQTDEVPTRPNPLLQKVGIDQKKAGNFLYYYKYHIVIGIIVLLVMIFTIRSCVTNVPPDFTTAFIGQIDYTDTDSLKKLIQAGVPDIKEPGFDGAFVTAEGNSEQDVAMMQKAMVLFAAADVDLFILDKSNFERYATQGAFISLDDIAVKLGADRDKNKDYILKTQDDAQEHLYGIDVSSSAVLKNSGILGSEFIAAIPARSKHRDTAVKLIEFLMK